MLRAIMSVLAGFVAMLVIAALEIPLAFSMPPGFVYQTDAPSVTPAWTAIDFTIALIAALVGGSVCRWIAKSPKPVRVLAVIILVLGLAEAGYYAISPLPTVTTEQFQKMTSMERAEHMRPELWHALALPVIGLVGVLTGGRAWKT